jgi:hypothetical protein
MICVSHLGVLKVFDKLLCVKYFCDRITKELRSRQSVCQVYLFFEFIENRVIFRINERLPITFLGNFGCESRNRSIFYVRIFYQYEIKLTQYFHPNFVVLQ